MRGKTKSGGESDLLQIRSWEATCGSGVIEKVKSILEGKQHN